MNRPAWILAFALVLLPSPSSAQDEKKNWKPFQFTGNERYDYKVVMTDGEEKKESGWSLDIRKKGEDEWDVTWATKSAMKKTAQGQEILMGGMAGLSPAMFLVNPFYGAFLEQVELKEGEKTSLLGAATIKVIKKETVGGRTGFVCELYTKQDDKEQMTWSCTIDPALALPIRSITFEGGKEKYRLDLSGYKKD